MNKHDYKQNAYYLLYLIRCVLHNKNPSKEKLDIINLTQLYQVAKAHSLTAIVAYALETAGMCDKAFTEAKNKAIRKNIVLDVERESVLEELENAGIWYCPLKGCIIKDWYPKIGMRQMADNDILCDPTKMTEIKEYMERLGFETKSFGSSHQDTYQKPPVCNFEMHSSLLEPRHGDVLYNYYNQIKSKLIKDDDKQYGYHFSNEDFYVYFVAHEYKHFAASGTGLRSLVDTYVINDHYNNRLNKDYISTEFERLSISDFEKEIATLANKLFSGTPLSSTDKSLLDKFILSGTYGSSEIRIDNQISNSRIKNKPLLFQYIIDRLTIPDFVLKHNYPFFYRHKLLRPFLYIKRLLNKLFTSPNSIYMELSTVYKKR